MGVKRGDVINLIVVSIPEAVYLVLACSKIGALANFINPMFEEAQIVDRINDTESPFLFVIDKLYSLAQKLIEKTCLERIIVIPISESMPWVLKTLTHKKIEIDGNSILWKGFLSLGDGKGNAASEYVQDTPVVMVYSSGTTGASKGILLTNDGIVATSVMESVSIPQAIDASFLAIIPIWFSTGISLSVLAVLANKGRVILEPEYSEKNFVRDIVRWKPECIVGTSSLYEFLMATNKKNLSFLKVVLSGGEPISFDFNKRINNYLKDKGCNLTLIKGYGQCELGGTVTLAKNGETGALGSVGIPLSQNMEKGISCLKSKTLFWNVKMF